MERYFAGLTWSLLYRGFVYNFVARITVDREGGFEGVILDEFGRAQIVGKSDSLEITFRRTNGLGRVRTYKFVRSQNGWTGNYSDSDGKGYAILGFIPDDVCKPWTHQPDFPVNT